MNDWSPPQRPAAYAEQALVTAILNGEYPPRSILPAERELAAQLGVTRPTLRETLQRLERDGWLTIQQGKSTRVNDYWLDGGLNVLNALVRYAEKLSPDFIPNLLEVRLAMAPSYTHQAVERSPEKVSECLAGVKVLKDTPEEYAAFDWRLHYTLTVASENPIFTLILNGFAGFYEQMARIYFENPLARKASLAYYRSLDDATLRKDALEAEKITHIMMKESIDLWKSHSGGER